MDALMLQDDLNPALAELRLHAASRMLSRATIRHRTGERIEAPSGAKVDEWAVLHADLPCRLTSTRGFQAPSRTVTAGEVEVTLATRVIHFPIGTAGIGDGDLVEIFDGENADTVWRVIEADSADQQTALRLPVIASQRPEEWL